MTIALVGSTGFVGSNLCKYGNIDKAYHSKNVEKAFGTEPDVLIYAGLRAEKYLANRDPEADMQLVMGAEDNIKKIAPKKLVLISTIDVLKDSKGKDENSEINTDGLQAYGLNRFRLEQWVRNQYSDALIIRLPGLFGINIKKNFIYDYINVIPFMLKPEMFRELSAKAPILKKYYYAHSNGFYGCYNLTAEQKTQLKGVFRELDFTALQFTDSRNVYQFYPLSRLYGDIDVCLNKNLTLWHPATEPVSAAQVYYYLTGKSFCNEISDTPLYYDYRTCYSEDFGGKDGYLMNRQQVLEAIKDFVKTEETRG